MAITYKAIATTTVGSGGAADITFSSIPATYTDLLIKASLRATPNALSGEFRITFNNDTAANYRNKYISGNGSSAFSGSYDGNSQGTTMFYVGEINGNGSSSTANTFSNFELYIPNYAGSNNKSISVDGVMETNATTSYMSLTAEAWLNTAAISTIKLYSLSANLMQYSTATLYGIKATV